MEAQVVLKISIILKRPKKTETKKDKLETKDKAGNIIHKNQTNIQVPKKPPIQLQ